MRRTTFSIRFFIRQKNAHNSEQAPVYMRLTVNRHSVEWHIKRTVLTAKWDQGGQCSTGRSDSDKNLNLYLNHLRKKVYEAQTKLEEKNKVVTATSLRNKAFGIQSEDQTLLKYYQDHNDKMEQLIGKDFARLTWIRHKTSLNNFREFLKYQYNKNDILMKELSTKICREYHHYLRTVRECNNNTSVKYVKNLGKIIKLAVVDELIDRNPLTGLRFKIEKVDVISLSQKELDNLSGFDIGNKGLEEVRDIFVFCCYTGLSYIDVKQLRENHFETDQYAHLWIRKKRGKTNVEFLVPLLEVPEGILRKYYDHPQVRNRPLLLPLKANQKYNEYLKNISELVGLEKNLTSHVARHTFGTVMLQRGISLEVVSKMMGHSNTKITQHYARVLEGRIRSEMSSLK
ncbi:MAG: site-specific integrase [Calditrichaeota bacterium]|jgi:site-specific recombinase XerD|nr:site-specific integrase [Calditrichota bacterium]